jgi:hypothetical protein
MELEDLREKEEIDIKHYLMLDARYARMGTPSPKGRSETLMNLDKICDSILARESKSDSNAIVGATRKSCTRRRFDV